MALLVDASVIIEAGESSGTLSQGWEILRLGRELFIFSSVMNNRSLAWPKKMRDYGARELLKPEDIFEFLPSGALDTLDRAPF